MHCTIRQLRQFLLCVGEGMEYYSEEDVCDENNSVNFLESFNKSNQDKNFVIFKKILAENVFNGGLARKCSQDCIDLSAYNLFTQRGGSKYKTRIFTPDKVKDGWDSKFTVIDVINDDQPFLVDSLTSELKDSNISIYNCINAVMDVDRIDGKLIRVYPKPREENANNESFIRFEITRIDDAVSRETLLKNVERTLDKVHACVDDWPAMVGEIDKCQKSISSYVKWFDKNDTSELSNFISWLKEDNFIFLGYRHYEQKKTQKNIMKKQKKSCLGFSRFEDDKIFGERVVKDKELFFVTRSRHFCNVHRRCYPDCIVVRRFDEDGEIVGEDHFIGMFTSYTKFQNIRTIPVIRKKVELVEQRSKFMVGGHSDKALIFMLQNTLCSKLLKVSVEELCDSYIDILHLHLLPKLKLFIYHTRSSAFFECMIFIPNNQFSSIVGDKVSDIVSKELMGKAVSSNIIINESDLVSLDLVIKKNNEKHIFSSADVLSIEKKLAHVVRSWVELLYNELVNRLGKSEGDKVYAMYRNAFPSDYKHTFTSSNSYYDIININKTIEKYESGQGNSMATLYQTVDMGRIRHNMKAYFVGNDCVLSDIIPIIENMAFKVINHHSYDMDVQHNNVYLHHFDLEAPNEAGFLLDNVREKCEFALEKLWAHELENDKFNGLITLAGLDWREVVLVRAISRYLKQLRVEYGQNYIQNVLLNYPSVVKNFIKLFCSKFTPSLDNKLRKESINTVMFQIDMLLDDIIDVSDDAILRKFIDVINATMRTNFYQLAEHGEQKSYISFKLDPSLIPNVPLPCPVVEVFVYSSNFEAVHLRGGKVARGGLRWSDRAEDYRSEVLGLMKAQMPKNTVIVPVGSKGGFFVKKDSKTKDVHLHGIECYKNFLRGILDITDNIVNGKIVAPKDVVRFDKDDPYLVVAADKGTATFSDHANSVSAEYNFWLGDAFASGGGYGYDHKKMAITAKGAWLSVQHHFLGMGIDIQKEDFTVIGIGDMAGDVFGNGMLLSEHIRLVAAFNHMHIFIDPNPNAELSYKERKRLFETPGTNWADYNKDLISKGGSIFSRSMKSIVIPCEIKESLQIKEDVLSPNELIKHILKAPVDLFWNGGIGTYVKSSSESNIEVHDKANDSLRINGCELKAKVIGEGGNLGFTQLGRIEYAYKNGRINTDFIDNSAGVGCSDREVNIKIALKMAMDNKKLTLSARNELLESMTPEVEKLVLIDNSLQNSILTIGTYRSLDKSDQYQKLIQALEKRGLLNRKVEFLPNDEELLRMKSEHKPLSRPQLAVLLSYAKMSLYDDLLKSDLPDDKYFDQHLLSYFPSVMQTKFKKEIINHPLRREIIATYIVNNLINRVGCSFVNHVVENTGLPCDVIARVFIIVRDIFAVSDIWSDVDNFPTLGLDTEVQDNILQSIQKMIGRASFWFFRHYNVHNSDIASIVKKFNPKFIEMRDNLPSNLDKHSLKELNKSRDNLINRKVDEKIVNQIAAIRHMHSSLGIITVASQNKDVDINIVCKIHFEIGAKLGVDVLYKLLSSLESGGYWQKLSARNLLDNIADCHITITSNIITMMAQENIEESAEAITVWVGKHKGNIVRYNAFIEEIKAIDNIDINVLLVAVARLSEIML